MGGGAGLFGFGKSKAKLYTKSLSTVTYDDVAGLSNAKKELVEIVDYLKDPSRYQSLGGELPKGILLVGPPGVGKTLMARAVAGEADIPFYSISGSEFIEMFVGVGASRVRDMFKKAKLDILVDALMEQEILDREDIEELLEPEEKDPEDGQEKKGEEASTEHRRSAAS